jgi:hypothetical protein
MNARFVTFVVIMAILGNVLSFVPIGLSRVGQVGFDLSLVTTFIVAFYGGPILGLITGFAGGITAGIQFGPLGWLSWLGLIGLPVGKALTGLTSGIIFKGLRINERKNPSLLTPLGVLIGYVPEFIFTVVFFLALVPSILGWSLEMSYGILIPIAIKAWMEMVLMGVLMGAIVGNSGFNGFMSTFFNSHKAK